MINIYTLITQVMNGTVTMMTNTDAFTTKELAEKTMERLKELNKNSPFPAIYTIQESQVFENEEEIPILKRND